MRPVILATNMSACKALFGSKNWCICFSFSLFLYSNSKIVYREKDPFLHLRVFGKLFWIHNLSIKFIIHGLVLFSIFFRKLLFFTYTRSRQSGGALCVFTVFMELLLYSFSMKMKTLKKCFYFLYSNSTFRILKMTTKYKFLNQTSFFFGGSL